MLNELLELRQSLDRCGVKLQARHPWLVPPAKGPGFRIMLDSQGKMVCVEPVPEMKRTFQIKKSNHEIFPVMKIQPPLLEFEEGRLFHVLEEFPNLQKTRKAINEAKPALGKKKKDIKRRLVEFPDKVIPPEELPEQLEILAELVRRAEKLMQRAETFEIELAQAFLKSLEEGRISDLESVRDLLFGAWRYSKKQGAWRPQKGKVKGIPVVFDVHDDGGRTIADLSQTKLTEYLIARSRTAEKESNRSYCSLTGGLGNVTTKFPQPSISGLGQVTLMSMNEDAPCHRRYGQIGALICPTAEETAQELDNAFTYLTQESRKYKTWQMVPNHRKGDPSLLVVFPTHLRELDSDFASLFSQGPQDAGVSGVDFEDVAARVCEALALKTTEGLEPSIRVLVFTKVDPGRTQIEVNSRFTRDQIMVGSRDWVEGTKNIPPISFPLFMRSGKAEKRNEVPVPWPSTVMELMKTKWIRSGTEPQAIVGVHLSDIYEILVNKNERVAQALLGELNARSGSLLLAFGLWGTLGPQASDRKRGASQTTKAWHRRMPAALSAVALAGILLAKLHRRKEVYMHQTPFLVGRLLHFVDELHKLYCEQVRKGDQGGKHVPNKLLGNSLMSTALENPEEALARLWDRFHVYQAWASTCQGEKAGLARWMLQEIGSVADELSQNEIMNSITETDKAEMTLGYLARPKKSDEENTTKIKESLALAKEGD